MTVAEKIEVMKEKTRKARERQEDDPSKMIQRSIKQELMSFKTNSNLHKICITGGPCAGKTTALAMI